MQLSSVLPAVWPLATAGAAITLKAAGIQLGIVTQGVDLGSSVREKIPNLLKYPSW
jgi:hypothetical protein